MAVGSRGDVAPYTGLGARLQEEGHEVTLATHGLFEELVRSRGLGFHALPLDTQEEMTSKLAASGTSSPLKVTLEVNKVVAAHATPMAQAMLAAARSADVAMLTPAGWIGGHVAEGLGLPSMGVYLQPMTPTREFPPCTVTTRSLGGWGNRQAATTLRSLGQKPFSKAVDQLRTELGLPLMKPGAWLAQVDAARWPICYGYSPIVVPQPADWPEWNHTVGYWWPAPDPDFKPAPELVDFLAAGPPPVYIGFGSMPVEDREALSQLVVSALRRSELRAVVNTGWAGLNTAGENVCTVAEVPHDWLFPQVAAVVHHAGAGTAAAGLRAGVPAVPVPFMVDQPFWAQRLRGLGVAPEVIPFRRLTADRLAAALTEATTNPEYRRRATDVAARLAREDGAAGVLRVLNQLSRA
ncbi:glycosyltransferase family 1 protein [Actinoplanes sp. LDG1-06]|uniref:Glycosyltransferase family 1 protein n=1 Tax=Paractinoplanes ovalisporus TaxID=2810368 RepID=A0ABS2AJW2_9ACTN|nr:glycosyltransferase [Actinoplanes ovalisporus]MBM2619536.1 glycosyltransferase family 1 protein [Actinoplanes ovalisporus]